MKLSAAKTFGLIEGKDNIKLTDLAKRILQPTSEQEKRDAISEAVNTPPLFNKLLNRFSGQETLPNLDVLKNILAREYNVPPKTTYRVVSAFIRSIQYVNVMGASTSKENVAQQESDQDEQEAETQTPYVFEKDAKDAIRIVMPGLDDAIIRIESEEDWDVVDSIIASLKRKWKKRKEVEN